MRDPVNILEVADVGPDYMGFIFYPASPRFVGDGFVMPSFPRDIARVGVFVNESTSGLLATAARHGLQFLQLHGDEPAGQCRDLKRNGLGVIKVFQVDDAMDFETTKPYAEVCDYFLFDTKGKYYGGNAQTFNWNILERYDQQVPFFLSGGLSASNANAVRKLDGMNLHALDVNSGVEVSPALKDVRKVKEIKQIVNQTTEL
ncbi:MAG TPA: phosphoribosylanthranilate isomerase [Chryseosolibacter sp.]|nr:phosphoribosylanthranilate isomerase [Chryseosolibacter sp.]